MAEEHKVYKGYIIAPGIQMPSYDVYEYEIFESFDAFERLRPLHTSESELEAEQWIDGQVKLGGHGAIIEVPLPPPEVTITEVEGTITAHIPSVRATAELTRMSQEGAAFFGLDPNNWLWFNRLINQSGIPRIGTLLLDKVMEYCKERGYSIANQVNAYGDISQYDLENWYIRKGFVPVDYGKYGNTFLMWSPQSSNPYPPRKGVIPKLPEEARGDFLFFEYIRDLCKYEALSEEDVRRLWEGWESQRGR